MSPRPKLWLTGEIDHADFAPAIQWLQEAARCQVIAVPRPATATDAPTAIVFFQARPGSIWQADVERLHRLAPLARLIIVSGPWCEGEPRWGRPPQGITRIVWHQWRIRLSRELGLHRLAIAAFRPRTMNPVECLLAAIPTAASSAPSRGAAAICTDRRQSFESLADLCRLAGFRPTWHQGRSPSGEDVAVVVACGWQSLIDLPPDDEPRPPVILLLDWPRPDDLVRAAQLGIRHVLSQPLLIADLLAALDELIPLRAASGAASPAA